MLVQQLQNVADHLILGLGEEIRLRESSLWNLCTGIIAAKLGDDVVEGLLGAEALPFQDFHNRGNLPHVGEGSFFDEHGFPFRAVIAHECSQQWGAS